MIATIKDKEVIPWKLLEGCSEDGLRRIATVCESSYQEESTGRTISTFGKSGPAVAREIYAYLDTLSGKTKKAVRGAKAAKPEHQIEVELIEEFKRLSLEAISTPPVIKFGTDRMHLRKAIASGWKPEDIKELMKLFFDYADDKFIFLKGDIKSLVSSLPRLSVIRNSSNEPGKPVTVAIDRGDIESTNNQ